MVLKFQLALQYIAFKPFHKHRRLVRFALRQIGGETAFADRIADLGFLHHMSLSRNDYDILNRYAKEEANVARLFSLLLLVLCFMDYVMSYTFDTYSDGRHSIPISPDDGNQLLLFFLFRLVTKLISRRDVTVYFHKGI